MSVTRGPCPPTADFTRSDRLSQLLDRIAARDEDAFTYLYRETSVQMLSTIRRQLVDFALSEEVCQEVFFEIWQTAARFQPARGNAISWMSVIARRRAIDRVRAVHASRRRDIRAGIKEWAGSDDLVSENQEILSEFRQASAAMETLTDLQREAVELVYRTGLTTIEAAERLGIPPNTFRTRLRAGLTSLRAVLT